MSMISLDGTVSGKSGAISHTTAMGYLSSYASCIEMENFLCTRYIQPSAMDEERDEEIRFIQQTTLNSDRRPGLLYEW